MTPLLEIDGLVKHFTQRRGFPRPVTTIVRAVDGVQLAVQAGEAFGLVGESGCGKSTVARLALRLIEPTGGSVRFAGEDVLAARGSSQRTLRRRMQIVFQDPFSSLNPRRTIGQTLMEPLIVHGIARGEAARSRAAALLEEVGLPPGALGRYPHEFSGGQRQRIGIARALVLEPELVVADEPVSALDVSVQAQVLMLLKALQARRGLAFLFVSHDLAVIRWFCTRVAVMYLGRIVEQGSVAEVFERPLHPYTRMLCDASPIPDPARRGVLPRVIGEIPSAAAPPPGCHFHPRCISATEICRGNTRLGMLNQTTGLPAITRLRAEERNEHDGLPSFESDQGCAAERTGLRGMPENGVGMGASSPLPNLWACRVLRRLAASPRHGAFPGHAASRH